MVKRVAKPFLKWAGGKTQLISEIEKSLPRFVVSKQFTYIEPFAGSGAVFFWMLDNFPNLERIVINDINEDLINTYKAIRSSSRELISILEILQAEYHSLEDAEDKKKEYYYKKRQLFNGRKSASVEHSALFIFLNRTCFNGLYRVNRKNEFNVPVGRYKRPAICDSSNLLAVSDVLHRVELFCGDFEQTIDYAGSDTIFYIDPPYKPLNATSDFNSYSKYEFGDAEQIRLKNFCDRLNSEGHRWILSNSDTGNFFDDLYSDFTIRRVEARRKINSKAEKRGILTELLITNG